MAKLEDLKKDDLLKRYNRILFGAPGTGKSYFLEKNKERAFDKNDNFVERVTFYPRYSYGQFVGMYKPVPADNGVTYKYVPGPFMRTYVKAKMAYDNYDAYKKDINDSNTKFFLFPTDPDTWYLFEKVTADFTEESFDATYRMKKNDIALIYVADKGDHKNQGKKPGIYAIGRIITDVKVNGINIGATIPMGISSQATSKASWYLAVNANKELNDKVNGSNRVLGIRAFAVSSTGKISQTPVYRCSVDPDAPIFGQTSELRFVQFDGAGNETASR